MRFSVAVTNYNYGRYLADAIDSVLGQTRPADQIVVVDDGSTDNSREVLDSYRDRVTIVHQENAGVAAATNTAVATCDGDVVCLLDADDLMLPERLEVLQDAYASHPDVEWVVHELQHIDRVTLEPKSTAPLFPGYIKGVTDVRDEARRGRLSVSVLAPAASALSWRTDFMKRLMPIPSTVRLQDNYLRFASFALAPGYTISTALSLQGIHSVNRYTSAAGWARDKFRAEDAVATGRGYSEFSQLAVLSDRLIGDALFLGRGGRRLGDPYKQDLYAHLRGLSARRRARVAYFFASATARGAYSRLRGILRGSSDGR